MKRLRHECDGFACGVQMVRVGCARCGDSMLVAKWKDDGKAMCEGCDVPIRKLHKCGSPFSGLNDVEHDPDAYRQAFFAQND